MFWSRASENSRFWSGKGDSQQTTFHRLCLHSLVMIIILLHSHLLPVAAFSGIEHLRSCCAPATTIAQLIYGQLVVLWLRCIPSDHCFLAAVKLMRFLEYVPSLAPPQRLYIHTKLGCISILYMCELYLKCIIVSIYTCACK